MKIVFMILVVLSGCALKEINNNSSSKPSRNNKNCIGSNKMIVSNSISSGIFARLCPVNVKSYYSDAFQACAVDGSDIFLPVKSELNNYVDDQKVTLQDGKCFSEDGVMFYTNQYLESSFQELKYKYKEKYGIELKESLPRKRMRKVKIIDTK